MLKRRLLALFLATCMLTVGCSITVQQKPDLNLPKPSSAKVFILGAITSDKPGWASLQPDFRRGFVKSLVKRKVFADIQDGSVPTDAALVLTGSITEVEEGDRFARAVIGFGAGKATLKGRFEVQDATGTTLLRFETHGALYGGIGILGGLGALVPPFSQDSALETTIHGFAVNVANTVARWSKGELTE